MAEGWEIEAVSVEASTITAGEITDDDIRGMKARVKQSIIAGHPISRHRRLTLRDHLSRFAERLVMAKGMGRARWALADWFNARYVDMCWSRLVNWVLGYESWWFPLEARGTAGQCERNGETPYCGKCYMRGEL